MDSGGAKRLWAQAQNGFSGYAFDPEARIDAEMPYGFDALQGLLRLYTVVALLSRTETLRTGALWKLSHAYEVSLVASFKKAGEDDETESGFMLRGLRIY